MGGLCGGIVSDLLFKGRRGPIMVLFSAITVPFAMAATQPLGTGPVDMNILRLIYFMLGFFSFAPHMLIGLTARELTPRKLVSQASNRASRLLQIPTAAQFQQGVGNGNFKRFFS